MKKDDFKNLATNIVPFVFKQNTKFRMVMCASITHFIIVIILQYRNSYPKVDN